ncbi:MAG TPA: Spy/CpxP family protein refolding chaperone [Acidobacteriota bacterium]|nr:Spy/CpxP family protein refolding chaperone [Acidobacteriota bacterium]
MKKILMIGVPIILVAGLLGAGAYGFRAHRHTMSKDFLEYRLDKLSKELDLTPAQQSQLDQIKQTVESKMDARMQKSSDIHKLIQDELSKDNPNLDKIRPLIDQRIDDMAQFGHEIVGQIDQFYNQLTPDQKKKLSDHIRERMADHEHAWGK